MFPSAHLYGTTCIEGRDIPLAAAAGDQQAALFGQAGFAPGDVKNTYGTGCFLLMNLGKECRISRHGLLTTLAAGQDDRPDFVMEGSVFVGGAVVQWLRDELGLIGSAAESEYFAEQVPDNGGVTVVPAFTGLGAPYWDMYARGTICGLTRGAGRNHIIRAALESIALQSSDLVAAMHADTGLPIRALRVDGGASANNFLMQFQADILGCEVLRPQVDRREVGKHAVVRRGFRGSLRALDGRRGRGRLRGSKLAQHLRHDGLQFFAILLYSSAEPSPARAVSLPSSTKPMRSSQRWNGAMAVRPNSSRRAAVSRKPVVW